MKFPLFSALFLASFLPAASATEDWIINAFDTAAEVPQWPTDDFPSKPANSWERWWGDAIVDGQSCSFDPAVNLGGVAGSGSMKVSADFQAGNGEFRQYSIVRWLPGGLFPAPEYASIEMDIKFKAGSAKRPNGSFGYLEFGFATTNYSGVYAFTQDIPATADTEWFHISAPIPLTNVNIDKTNAIHFKMWGGDDLNGNSTFWVDNIKLIGKEVTGPEIVPTLEALPAGAPGLKLIAAGAGIYDRQNLRTAVPSYGWVGRSQPVTYSVTIADYPAVADFQTHLYFVPGADAPATMPDPDWTRPDCAVLAIGSNATGGGWAGLRYKVNAPSSNGVAGHEYWTADDGVNGGNIAGVGSSTIIGKWSVTFSNDTDFVLTSPDGSTAQGSFSAVAAAEFSGETFVYCGIVPGAEDRRNRTVTIGKIEMTGGFETPITETFALPAVDTATWAVSAGVPGAVVPVVASEHPFWLSWSLPAIGYTLQDSTDLTELNWTGSIPETAAFGMAGGRRVLVNRSLFPDPESPRRFFRLFKQLPE